MDLMWDFLFRLEGGDNAQVCRLFPFGDLMLVDEYGKSPVEPRPFTAALYTFFSFLLCGLIPLLPFLMGLQNAFQWSILCTGIIFLLIGMLKSKWSLQAWWQSGFETLAIGASAAAIAYYIGWLLRSLAIGV